jgi:hypothetical protein
MAEFPLRYGFSQYTKPSDGNVNNFTVLGILVSINFKWP